MAAAQLDHLLKHLYDLMPVQGLESLSDAELLRRFTVRGEEVAFAALVRRHGPLVLQVCQRLLHDSNTAEDVFQAAFLVLARKAKSLRKPESVGSFLYGVAYRLARRTRVEAARQQFHERRHLVPPPVDPLAEVSGRELLEVLEGELHRLPSKYRSPLVLCCLQDRTRDEAAALLGLTLRTLQRRLEQGRTLLHARLTRRGLTLSVPLLGTLLAPPASSALPVRLFTPTVRAALAFTSRSAGVAGLRSARAIALAEGILRTMFVTKLKIAASLMLTMTLFVAGMCALPARTGPAPKAVAPTPSAHARTAPGAPPVVPAVDECVIKIDDAVAAGLQWVVGQQQRDGRWWLEGAGAQRNDIAATALALLPLLGSGHTHKRTDALHPYARPVERGLRFLLIKQNAAGGFRNEMYAHALAACAVCEAYGLTADPWLKEPAQKAIDFIVKAQHKEGGWRYLPGQLGDLSSTSYQIHALVAARAAGLTVPKETLTRAGGFLDACASQDGSEYSYTPGSRSTQSMTAAGHLCRLELGGKTDAKGLLQWTAKLRRQTPLDGKGGLYYYHYLASALRLRGAEDWDFWEPKIRKILLDKQDQGQKKAALRGSWPTEGERFGQAAGRLMMTSLALVTLQTCARTDKLSWRLTKEDAGKLPAGWKSAQTGKGKGSVWKVVADESAPSKSGYVLAQTAEGPSKLFNLCVAEDSKYKDVEIQVAFKALRGKEDQGGGIVWRYRDANNYYVARMNPLESNYRVYKVVAGKRSQLGTKEDLKIPVGEWHNLKIKQKGEQIECWLDGKKYLEVKDDTFTKAGKIGLWTKADAQTAFDNLRVRGDN